ncbi:MAG TPA: succinate dehydrogenase, hydrophobic membrane anchor protein, partial [Longimicrobium sp.]|nr:succinate dehydrogenase, hydrophobic membrane anchor protein [Longimicrobium sp.]
MSRGAPRPGGGYRRPDAAPRNGGRFEVRSWLFMRVTGVLLLFMVLYHLVWWNLLVGVEHLSAEMVLERWNNPLWRLFNVGLATFALLHGLNGLRYSIEDYVRNPKARRIAKGIAYTVVLLTLAWGVFALLTF